jgi:hypothetical protein
MPARIAALYAACALVALIVAALLPVPRLYVPLYLCGLACCGLLVEIAIIIFQRFFGERARAGLTLTCAIAALVLQYIGTFLPAAHPATPEPVLPGQLFLGQLEGVLAVAAVFFSLQAVRDRLAAWLGLCLALVTLFLIGLCGTATYFDQVRALSVMLAAVLTLVLVALHFALPKGRRSE